MSSISPPPPPPISTSTPHRRHRRHPSSNPDTKAADRHARLLPEAPRTLDEFALAGLLKASALLLPPDPRLARQLHARSVRAGLCSDCGVRTSLVAAYSASGSLSSSRALFDELPPALNTDAPTWNSMITACARHGRHEESLRLFSSMLGDARLAPTDATYVVLVGSCASSGDIGTGKTLHGRIVKARMADETKLQSCLITFYAKCALLGDARKVFDDATIGGGGGGGKTNVVSWNAMIAGYGQNGEGQLALDLFGRLVNSDARGAAVEPNTITFLCALSAASSVANSRAGREVHGRIIRFGLETETSVGNSLVTMYGRCGEPAKARLVFESMPRRDCASWNAMLAVYARNEECEKCRELFSEMRSTGIEPDHRTLTVLLGAVSSGSSESMGREIHGYLLRRSISEEQTVSVCTAIIAMYAKSARVKDAEKVFKRMRQRDSHAWNAMMDGYSVDGRCDDALALFVEMLYGGFEFDHLTISILLTVCSRLVSVRLGRQLHAVALKHKHSWLSVDNALVSMYSKCGCIDEADSVFRRTMRKDVFSWTAMITGNAHHGLACEALHLFERMVSEGVKPNSVTFLGLLTACAHAGLVDEGTRYFDAMRKETGSEPGIEHYACMVDLFGRSGQLGRAAAMVETGNSCLAPKHGSCASLWHVLLGACHAHKQLEMGERAAARILELEPEDETTHVLLSNLYASFGLWREANGVRRRMRELGLKKEAGYSWVEVGCGRHVFVAGDVCHPNTEEIHENLANLEDKCRGLGYAPMTELVLHDVDEARKEAILGSHSEKLAVSFGILQTRTQKGTIRVIKNLRVCGDCHNWMKIISQVEEREIVVRDSKRFHSFKNGSCSCGDYW